MPGAARRWRSFTAASGRRRRWPWLRRDLRPPRASYHVHASRYKLGMGYTDLPKTTPSYPDERHHQADVTASFGPLASRARSSWATRAARCRPRASRSIIRTRDAPSSSSIRTRSPPDDVVLPAGAGPCAGEPGSHHARTGARRRPQDTLSYNKAFHDRRDGPIRIPDSRSRRNARSRTALRRRQARVDSQDPDRVKAMPSIVRRRAGPLVWWSSSTPTRTLDLIRAGHLNMPVAIIWGWTISFAPDPFGARRDADDQPSQRPHRDASREPFRPFVGLPKSPSR